MNSPSLTFSQRVLVLVVAFSGLVFDGFELGLMPQASLPVTVDLMGKEYADAHGPQWFAWYTASLMLGAACGGIVLGNLGDRWGRSRAMSLSIIIYSAFAGLGAWANTQEQMLMLRFFVGMGTGGMLPNGVALVSECWPNASRVVIAGIMGAGINVGILLFGQTTQFYPVDAESWRWVFKIAAMPALLGIFSLLFLPESPTWIANRGRSKGSSISLMELFRGRLLRVTILGILLGAIPLLGAWAASKWMVPWTDKIATAALAAYDGSDATTIAHFKGYKGAVQFYWALGAILGSFLGAHIAVWLGRRWSYFIISLSAVSLTWVMFQMTEPLKPEFLKIVFAQGFASTLCFGWLPMYLPELFPTRARATGMGLSYNVGRFATAIGVLLAGGLLVSLKPFVDNDPSRAMALTGALCGLVYSLGLIVIWFAPNTAGQSLEDEA